MSETYSNEQLEDARDAFRARHPQWQSSPTHDVEEAAWLSGYLACSNDERRMRDGLAETKRRVSSPASEGPTCERCGGSHGDVTENRYVERLVKDGAPHCCAVDHCDEWMCYCGPEDECRKCGGSGDDRGG